MASVVEPPTAPKVEGELTDAGIITEKNSEAGAKITEGSVEQTSIEPQA